MLRSGRAMLISFTRRSVYLRDSSAPREDLLTGLPQTSSANPFSSRFVRPGSIAYRFSGDWDEATVGGQLLQWSTRNFAASIVGPHGTGKSTLLHTLAPYLATAGYELLWFRLSQADRGGAAQAHHFRLAMWWACAGPPRFFPLQRRVRARWSHPTM